MKKCVLFLVFAGLFSFTYSQSVNWEIVQVNAANANFTDISFVNDSTGYVVGNDGTDNFIFKTTDYGKNWTNVVTNDVAELVRTIDFYDADHGLVGGKNGGLYKTDDGGSSWSVVPTGTNVEFIDVSYPKDKVAYLCSADGRFFQFNGFGLLSNTIHTPDDFVKVQFVDQNTGFIVAMQGNVWMTTDGGTNWDTIKTKQQLLKGGFFLNASTGYVVGPKGKLEYTANAGLTWMESTLNIHQTVQFNDVYFLNTAFGLLAGNNGKVIVTFDGGSTWKEEETGTTENINVLVFPRFDYGYAAGENGLVLRRTLKSGIARESTLNIQIYPNPVLDEVNVIHNYNNLDIVVFDINGKKVIEKTNFKSIRFSLGDLESGIYFLRILNEEGQYYQKLILE